MKKFTSIIFALVLALSMSTVVFAANVDTNADMSTITITKNYEATNTGTTSPAEAFYFTISNTSVTDAATDVTVQNMPTPTIGSVLYEKGDAGSENKSKQITVTLPEYISVGIYTYTIKETVGTTAGVTYYGSDIKLVVTVQQGSNGQIRVAAVHTESEGAAKSDNFPNIYSAGSLSVTKNVTGNMGDQTKEFNVTVTFTAPADKSVKEAITYTDGTETKTIPANWTNGVATADITLKHGETVTFTNIPYGVTYSVKEADYTGANGGYDSASYSFTDESKKIDSASDTVTITNKKGVDVDTGIFVDSLPYILILAIVAVGLVVFFGKKRMMRED